MQDRKLKTHLNGQDVAEVDDCEDVGSVEDLQGAQRQQSKHPSDDSDWCRRRWRCSSSEPPQQHIALQEETPTVSFTLPGPCLGYAFSSRPCEQRLNWGGQVAEVFLPHSASNCGFTILVKMCLTQKEIAPTFHNG